MLASVPDSWIKYNLPDLGPVVDRVSCTIGLLAVDPACKRHEQELEMDGISQPLILRR